MLKPNSGVFARFRFICPLRSTRYRELTEFWPAQAFFPKEVTTETPRRRHSTRAPRSQTSLRFVLAPRGRPAHRSEEHTSELQSRLHLVCRLLLEKKKKKKHDLCIRPQVKPPST